ncbi:MAG TPA: hypothetical protein VMG30_03050 [Acidobacteriota bacterium]|nr:hypothetical protein [Acidobacteriota bacterium]
MTLKELAYARSGDKGSNVNIGVIAYTREDYFFLKEHLTEQKVAHYFSRLGCRQVRRFDLPNLLAFNFVLYGALQGGGSVSLRTDAQGKALGQAILQMSFEVEP